MKILFVINQPYPFGMAGTLRIKLFAEFLQQSGFYSRVLVNNQDNGNNTNAGTHNDVLFSTILHKKFPKLLLVIVHPFLALYHLTLFRMHTGSGKAIIVIYGDVDLYTLPFVIFGKIFGCKVVLDIVEDRILSNEKFTILGKINASFRESILPCALRIVDGIIVISRYLKDKYQHLSPSKPILLIPASAANLDANNFDEQVKNSYLQIVYCGSFGIKDGVDYLLKAFQVIAEKYPSVHLKLLGKPTELIVNQISELNNKNIELTGYLPDEEYWPALYQADILCMTRIDSPFSHAGFPFKLGEYLATGKAVIATDVSDVSFYLNDKEDIVIAKPSNAESLVESIEFLINHPEQMRTIGANGLRKCKKLFNPKINGEMMKDFIRKI